MAGSHGHFELNVFNPNAHNILQSINLLADSKTFHFTVLRLKLIKIKLKNI